ncbi:MAG TPA: Uma2 family endonuclease [Thermoanaerobaculia bacterium]
MSYTPRLNSVVPVEDDDMAIAETEVHTTREEYVRMVEAGVFEGRRVELIDGVVYEMPPQLSPHASTVMLAQEVLRAVFSPGFSLRCQMPLDVGVESMPEPDLAIVPGAPRDYYAAHPTGAALVLEVTDTSQYHDRKRKARSYAKACIQDYWILNLARDVLEVYRDPVGDTYRTRLALRRGEQIAPLARPDAPIAVADLLPFRPGSAPK